MTEVIADLERNGGNSSTLNDPHAVTTALDKDAITALRNLDVSVATARTAVKKQSPATKPSSGKQPPWKNTKVLIGAGVLGVLMFLGVILIVRDKDGKEVARIDATDGTKVTLPAGGSVQVESTAATPQTKSSPPPSSVKPTPKPTTSQPVASSEVKPVSGPQPTGNFALEFDGIDDVVEVLSFPQLSHAPFTCEAHITPKVLSRETTNDERGCIFIGGGISVDIRYFLPQAGSFYSMLRGKYVDSKCPTPPNRQLHIASTFDGKLLRVHINGKAVGRPTEITSSPDSGPTKIGPAKFGASEPTKKYAFEGLIDELRISRKARYTADFTPELRFEPDDDTVALYHFDEGTGDILRDSSKNHYDGKIVGAKWVRADGSPINSAPASTGAPPLAKAPFDAAQAKALQQSWAKHLGTQVETTNSVGMKMVLIPPGEFMMGSTDEQVEAALKVAEEIKAEQHAKDRIQKNERPQHKVVITKPFLMSSREVTVGQFKKFTATGYQTEAEKTEADLQQRATPTANQLASPPTQVQTYLNLGKADDRPASVITWNDAVAYCEWLTLQEGRTCRLPTEAEWEYACRAGTATQYSYGDDHNELSKYGSHKYFTDQTSEHKRLPNSFGLYDTHGSLWEWCSDYYDDYWYEKVFFA